MGGMYAMTSLVKLVALFGKDGITKEEIQRLNKESFSAKLNWDYQFANALDMASFNEYVQFREGKYYPNLEKIDLGHCEKSYKAVMEERVEWERKKIGTDSLDD